MEILRQISAEIDTQTYFVECFYGWRDPGTDYEAKVLGQANRAIALDADNVWAYTVKGLYLSLGVAPIQRSPRRH